MASQFKIPKKKHSPDSDSAQRPRLFPLSPLSHLHSQAAQTETQGYEDQSDRTGADRMRTRNQLNSSTNRQRVELKKLLNRDGESAASHRDGTSLATPSNRWHPKRASDRLLQPVVTSEQASPPQKKKSSDCSVETFSASSSETKSISVVSVDSLADLRAGGSAGSRCPLRVRVQMSGEFSGNRTKTDATESKLIRGNSQEKQNNNPSLSDPTSEDDFVSPSRNVCCRTSSASVSSVKLSRTTPDRRRTLKQTASESLMDDVRERERQRWREFRERKGVPHHRQTSCKKSPAEPIVLSSEEEEECRSDTEKAGRISLSHSSKTEECCLGQRQQPSRAQRVHDMLPPSFLQLEFTSLHAGLMHAQANGKMLITENGITLPLKVSEEKMGDVTLVASQLRGYGVWDGGVAQGGALLSGWEGEAPSLLFLWVTDAQANLLQSELSAIQMSTPTGPLCPFLLVVLKKQLQELQAALFASILDMEEYQRGCSSSSGGPSSPIDWTDGLLLLHSCPPPMDQHILRLLGHSESGPVRSTRSSVNSSGLQQLPNRLIQYPAPPSKGRIAVTKEDLACLNAGEFLNDVIIDFYLKFLLLEGVGGSVAERSHVFSSFFYRQLSRRRVAGEEDALPDCRMRHRRVKNWTRHVDIFTKDFLFVPVNHEAHWFLVVVCFPALDEAEYRKLQSSTGSEKMEGKTHVSVKQPPPPDCTQWGCLRNTVLKRPCILVMDSLKLSNHDYACRLLRDYLQVEWEARRRTSCRLFTADKMRSSSCRVPQQDNSSDCGLYLLQYVESFLQNPIVHFELPLRLDNWFPRQQVRQKREEIRRLIVRMHQSQSAT